MDSGTLALILILGAILVVAIAEEVIRYNRKRAWNAQFRPCPRCGLDVERGKLDCPHCGFDFRTVGSQPS